MQAGGDTHARAHDRADEDCRHQADRIDRVDWISPAVGVRLAGELQGRVDGEEDARGRVEVAVDQEISRDEVYEVANFSPSRSLRGFTRPARRITRELIRQEIVSPDALWPLQTRYAGSSVQATHFLVPTEFTDYIHQITD